MVHLCHARGCKTPVPPKMFMCKRHWFMLPKRTRDAVWATYRPGQEVTKDPSPEYMDVTAEAIAWLDAIEHDRLDVPSGGAS
jgi:hypothetical protein